MNIIDLTHTFDNEMPVYPGDPVPELQQTAEIDRDGLNEYHLCTGMHVGTHMDSPLHMVADGTFMSDIAPDRFFGRGKLIDARGKTQITPDLLDRVEIKEGDVALVLTGWYKNFRNPGYYDGYPVVDPEFASILVSRGASIMGLDTPSPDHSPFPVHKILLSQGVLIVENLTNLEDLLDVDEFEVVALPVRMRCEGAPARVVARVGNTALP